MGCASGVPGAESRPQAASVTGGQPAQEVMAQPYSAADVRFMQQMIPHHAQALLMTGMVEARTERPAMLLLAERIEHSQVSEIDMMRQWLTRRGESVPDVTPEHAHHAIDHSHSMAGMLNDEEIAKLSAASGDEFDRLFLVYMIRHHEGALAMVGELFATPGGGQETETFSLASDVDADQRAEIRRMQAMLDSLQEP